MIDIHSHILPGIDDGAPDLEESVRICELAANLGCQVMVATPHQCHPAWWNTEPLKLQVLLDRIQSRLGDRIRLHLGAEIRVGSSFLRDLEHFDSSGLVAMAGSEYLMLEFERRQISVDPVEIVEKTCALGWRPIIAHPELIGAFGTDRRLAEQLVIAGALLQVTAMSVTGDFGLEPKKRAWSLLKAGLAHFMASDCHGHRRRPPGLKGAHAKIRTALGADYADQLTVDNPRAVIDNRPIERSRLGVVTARE